MREVLVELLVADLAVGVRVRVRVRARVRVEEPGSSQLGGSVPALVMAYLRVRVG